MSPLALGLEWAAPLAPPPASPWRRRLAIAALTLLTAALALLVPHRQRLRFAALPVWSDPSHPAGDDAPRRAIAARSPAEVTERADLPSRVTAIAAAGDTVFAATFTSGVFRLDAAGEPQPVGALDGRARFVDALVTTPDGAHVVAATHDGAVLLDAAGRRVATFADGHPLACALVVDGVVVLGGAHGLWIGGAPREVHGPEGEPVRVTALAHAAGRLWLGSPDGVYSLPWPLPPSATPARWQPLVFGAPPAGSNVVTALAPLGDGVLAATDDGGYARVNDAGVRAERYLEPCANGANPGALLARDGVVLVGTEGAGLLVLDPSGAARPAHWTLHRVSALGQVGDHLWVGAADGSLVTVTL